MYGFMYFADGIVNPLSETIIASLGLSYAFPTAPMWALLQDRTPSGRAGTIMAIGERMPNGDLAYRPPPVQAWRKRPGDDCVWVGYWNDHRPTPEGLAREKQLPGDRVLLADGNSWKVPRLLAHDGESGFAVDLPCYADLDENGRWVNGGVLKEYADAAAFAERIYEGVIKAELGEGKRLTSEEVLAMSARLLQYNYCISEIEAAMLQLFPVDADLKNIVKAAADWERFVTWCDKKKESALIG